MKFLIASALLLGATPAANVTVETATGSWDRLPLLKHGGYDHLNRGAITEVHEAAIKEGCKLPGQRGKELKLNLPFAVQFNPDGTLNRVLLPKLDCARAEGVLGGVIVEMIQGGDYKPSGGSPEGWYQGALRFSSTL